MFLELAKKYSSTIRVNRAEGVTKADGKLANYRTKAQQWRGQEAG